MKELSFVLVLVCFLACTYAQVHPDIAEDAYLDSVRDGKLALFSTLIDVNFDLICLFSWAFSESSVTPLRNTS